MPDLLIELFCEEIPARMQARAERDLADTLTARLEAAGLGMGDVVALSGPRRLCVAIEALDARSKDVSEERKGPKIGAPDKAVEGFLRGAGLQTIAQAEIRKDDRKGDFYVARIETPGRDATAIISEIVPDIIRSFHWPKSMRWGTGDLRWVRPLQRILCIFDGKPVAFEVDGLVAGHLTEGHRVHGRGPFEIRSFEQYRDTLEGEGHVRLARADRKALILKQAEAACRKAKLELVPDEGLLEEVTGLAEWPVVVLGDMDARFLDLPPEVITLSMRTHQKYFALREAGTGTLAPHFITVANIAAADGGKTIAAGNAKVLSARLEDARFFWENDKAKGLDAMSPDLARIDFKKELGSMADKVERVAGLARELAAKVGADRDEAERAARLAKADLVSEMVYEFPELQGVMGRYYALEQGESQSVADAIRDHYKPQGPTDDVPTDPVGIAVALADKLDTLTGFWAIDEKPTGSKDPFALRRAALGVIRLILTNELRFSLDRVNDAQVLKHQIGSDAVSSAMPEFVGLFGNIIAHGIKSDEARACLSAIPNEKAPWADLVVAHDPAISDDLLDFLHDRLKVYLRDTGVRHDLLDACLAMPDRCDLKLVVNRVQALGDFLAAEDGRELMTGYKRAANILRAEEKKDGAAYTDFSAVDPGLFHEKAEQALHVALVDARASAEAALEKENFEGAMTALAGLRAPVDAFFETVTVNAEDADVRRNRLLILAGIRDALHSVADVSKIEG